MILYPTETLYALGVNALDAQELQKLYALKERDATKAASWLVRSIEDIKRYAEVSETAAKIAEQFLPGSLTLILPARESVDKNVIAQDGTIGFRMSSDPVAQTLIAEYMEAHNAPLTCTSANVSGSPTLPTVGEIQQQFGARAGNIKRVIDGGPRKGLASTIVRVIGEEVVLLREGEIGEKEILAIL